MLPHQDPNLYRRLKVEKIEEAIEPPPAPLARAREVSVEFVRARATPANPQGKIKAVVLDPDFAADLVDRPVDVSSSVTQGLKRCREILDSLGPGAQGRVWLTWSYGFEMNAAGGAKTDPIWEISYSEEEGKSRRRKVGESPPRAKDSFMVQIVMNLDSRWLKAEGLWIDGTPNTFAFASHATSLTYCTFTEWKKAIEEHAPHTPHLLSED